jgi:hypothetical protein
LTRSRQADTIAAVLHRVQVIVAALALLMGFVSAPYEHLHRTEGVRHAHVTPHDHGHHHDLPVPAGNEHDDDSTDVLSADGFLSSGAVRVVPPAPSDVPALRVGFPLTLAVPLIERSHPPANGPPAADRLPSRAPPAVPAA